MDAPRLYRFRAEAIGFTRGQLFVIIAALLLAAAGVVVLVVGKEVIAAGMLGIAGASMGLTTVLAHANTRPPPT